MNSLAPDCSSLPVIATPPQAEMAQAVDLGLSRATHLFNAMSQLNAREPGLVGAALEDERLFAGSSATASMWTPSVCVSLSVARAAIG